MKIYSASGVGREKMKHGVMSVVPTFKSRGCALSASTNCARTREPPYSSHVVRGKKQTVNGTNMSSLRVEKWGKFYVLAKFSWVKWAMMIHLSTFLELNELNLKLWKEIYICGKARLVLKQEKMVPHLEVIDYFLSPSLPLHVLPSLSLTH